MKNGLNRKGSATEVSLCLDCRLWSVFLSYLFISQVLALRLYIYVHAFRMIFNTYFF
jgi:hypothetical protein